MNEIRQSDAGVTAPPRPPAQHHTAPRQGTPARPSTWDKAADFIITAAGWLALFLCGALVGIAAFYLYLQQNGVTP